MHSIYINETYTVLLKCQKIASVNGDIFRFNQTKEVSFVKT